LEQHSVLVIPCFNEEARLQPRAFAALLEDPRVQLLFVNDGSTDDTELALKLIADAHGSRVRVLTLEQNSGKAEAVRRGMSEALHSNPFGVGYLDADLATPPSEILRLLRVLYDRDVAVVLGSRIALLGRHIERSPARHYLGRLFATLASAALSLPVYDTQCGAKVFRGTDGLRYALSEPFMSRWAFDVELIGRLVRGGPETAPLDIKAFHEEPLLEWHDVAGSKLRATHMARSLYDLGQIARDLRRRRRPKGRS
jgi:dolichyl-phosphate beta-glucosyltransferase